MNRSAELNTALAALGKHLGVEFDDVQNLRPRHGSLVAAAALAAGVRVRAVRLTPGWQDSPSFAFLAYSGIDQQPIAVIPRSSSRWDWIDPATGKQFRLSPEVSASLQPTALTLTRPLPAGPVTARTLVRWLMPVIGPSLTTLMVLGLVTAAISLITPVVANLIFGQVIPSGEQRLLVGVGVLLVGAGITSVLLTYLQRMAETRIAGLLMGTLVPAVWDRMLRLPASFFRGFSVGDLYARTASLSAIRTGLRGAIQLTLAVVSGAASVLFVIVLNWQLGLLVVAMVLIATAIVVPFTLIRARLTARALAAHGRVTDIEFQLLATASHLRIAGASERAHRVWADLFAAQLRIGWRLIRVSLVATAVAGLLPAVMMATIYAVSGTALLTTLDAGSFMGVLTAIGMVSAAFARFRTALDRLVEDYPAYRRFRPLLMAAEEDNPDAASISLRGAIELDQVSFRYDVDAAPTLDAVSMRAEPGQFVAITGPSGAGKTTVTRLLLGFEEPESGSVSFDGTDLRFLRKSEVRAQIGVVKQRAATVPGTVAAVIAGDRPATIDQIWQAAEQAGIAGELRTLPMGLNTVLTEGSAGFSPAFTQRIALARALVGEPALLILDEATSALDSAAQAQITSMLAELRMTKVVIAHRLATIRSADRIYVLDAGCVVQAGTFDELVAVPGVFRTLAEHQFADLGALTDPVNR